jgi:hypothetical protein
MGLSSPHFTSESPQHHHKNTTQKTPVFPKTPLKSPKSAEIPRRRQSNFFSET